MTASSGARLKRYFGQWSEEYQRYTTNLRSSDVTVRVLGPEEQPNTGIQCIVHWVDRSALLSTDAGSVCASDGWPVELWHSLLAALRRRDSRGVADGLRELVLAGPNDAEDSSIAAWRSAIASRAADMEAAHQRWTNRWLPVAAELLTQQGPTACIVSWSPTARPFASLSEAIAIGMADGRGIDRESQAVYYLECTLATMHGVRFGLDDQIVDKDYEETPEVKRLLPLYQYREAQHVADAAFGDLACRGPALN
jgi:hypothetical protein